MACLYIRLRPTTAQRATTQSVTLDGVAVQLRARYTAAADGWYLDILDTGGTAIVTGLALVPGVDLLRPFRHLAVPPGTLFVHGDAPTLESMDVTSRLLYREA